MKPLRTREMVVTLIRMLTRSRNVTSEHEGRPPAAPWMDRTLSTQISIMEISLFDQSCFVRQVPIDLVRIL